MKVTVLYSGGMDSLAMSILASREGHDVDCVAYDIGQPYRHAEQDAIARTMKTFGPTICVPIFAKRVDWLKPGQGLFSREGSSAGAITIPGRNLVLATLAACQFLPDEVWLGTVWGEESAQNVDQNRTFAAMSTACIGYALSDVRPTGTRIELPFVTRCWNKLVIANELSAFCVDNGIPKREIDRCTVSCVGDPVGTRHCGRCTSCLRRWAAFVQIGMIPCEGNVSEVGEMFDISPLDDQGQLKKIVAHFDGKYLPQRGVEITGPVSKWLRINAGVEPKEARQWVSDRIV